MGTLTQLMCPLINTFDEVQLFPPVVQSVQGVIHSTNPGSVNCSSTSFLIGCQFANLWVFAKTGLKSEHYGRRQQFYYQLGTNWNPIKFYEFYDKCTFQSYPWRQWKAMTNTVSCLDSTWTLQTNTCNHIYHSHYQFYSYIIWQTPSMTWPNKSKVDAGFDDNACDVFERGEGEFDLRRDSKTPSNLPTGFEETCGIVVTRDFRSNPTESVLF